MKIYIIELIFAQHFKHVVCGSLKLLFAFVVKTGRKMTATASAVTSDPAEFVRNTDLVMEAATVIGNKTGINGKLSGIRDRISETLGKLKAGSK